MRRRSAAPAAPLHRPCSADRTPPRTSPGTPPRTPPGILLARTRMMPSGYASKLKAEVSMQEHRSTFQHAGAQEHGSEFSAWMPMIPTVHVSKLSFKAHSGSLSSMQEHRSTGASSRRRGDIVRHASLEAGGWCRRWQALCEVPVRAYTCGFPVSLCSLSLHFVCALWLLPYGMIP